MSAPLVAAGQQFYKGPGYRHVTPGTEAALLKAMLGCEYGSEQDIRCLLTRLPARHALPARGAACTPCPSKVGAQPRAMPNQRPAAAPSARSLNAATLRSETDLLVSDQVSDRGESKRYKLSFSLPWAYSGALPAPPACLREPASAHRRRRPGTPLRTCGRASGQRMRSPRKAPAAPPPATPIAASMGPPRASHKPSCPLPVCASRPRSGHADRLLGPLQQLRREVVGKLGQRAERALARGRRLDAKACARGTKPRPLADRHSVLVAHNKNAHLRITCPDAKACISAKPFCRPLTVREARCACTLTKHTQRECRACPRVGHAKVRAGHHQARAAGHRFTRTGQQTRCCTKEVM